jgi:hypothetical protein
MSLDKEPSKAFWFRLFDQIDCEDFRKRGKCLAKCAYKGKVVDLCCLACKFVRVCPNCCPTIRAKVKRVIR